MTNEIDTSLLELTSPTPTAMIKVIGIGGGGGNAVSNMFRVGLRDVSFAVVNTDKKHLQDSPVKEKVQLGPGLGAGGNPETGRELAEAHLDQIQAIFNPEVKMVFITAGEGGGTGTGVSPIVAREARKKGLLTIGVVTLPFRFEGPKQIDKALDGMERLAKEVDAIIIINNERLRELFHTQSLLDGFAQADKTLYNAVKSIVEVTFMRGTINLDFQDVSTVLSDGGVAIMSQGYARGEHRLTHALEEALNSPILNNNNIFLASRVVLKITTSTKPEEQLTMDEFGELTTFFSHFPFNLFTKYGLEFDTTMEDGVKVVLLASGFGLYDKEVVSNIPPIPTDREVRQRERISKFYPTENRGRMRRIYRHYVFSTEDLDNEEIIEKLDNLPTRDRTQAQLKKIRELADPSTATTLDLTDPI
ncbi:MAG: cell division FtsZ family protein [Alloprevotella sp.]|nr:cell division FtsZ family protein [Alloprevotella sp.]